MTKETLKKMLEEYWYDSQYLKEKTKEIEKFSQLIKADGPRLLLTEAHKYEENQLLGIIEKKKYIENLIQKLAQPYRTIMYMKYICFLSFDQIADRINYSTKRIYQLHSEAFCKLLEIVNQGELNISTN